MSDKPTKRPEPTRRIPAVDSLDIGERMREIAREEGRPIHDPFERQKGLFDA